MSEENSSTTKPFALTDLLGPKAISTQGDAIDIATEWVGKKDAIALYFSAHWCPPCRKFTPKLAKAYKEYAESANVDESFELVFVSSDSDEDAFKEYHGEMTFPALDYQELQKDVKKGLNEKYKLRGIPALVIIDAKTGERLDDFREDDDDDDDDSNEEKKSATEEPKWIMSPREMVDGYGSMAFPLSEASAKRCKDSANAAQQKALAELLTLPNALLPPKKGDAKSDGEPVTFAKLLSSYEYVSIWLGCNMGLSGIPGVSKTLNEVNTGNDDNGKKVAAVYVPDAFPNPYEDAEVEGEEAENYHYLFHFQEKPTKEVTNLLLGLAGQTIKFDSLVTVQQTMQEVEECGMDGVCTSRSVPLVTAVSVDEYMQKASHHGSKYFPWTKELIDQAKAAEKARAEEVKSKLEASVESFLLELTAGGHIVMGDSKSEEAITSRLKDLDDQEGIVAFYFVAHDETLAGDLLNCLEQLNPSDNKHKMEVLFVAPEWGLEELKKAYAKMVTKHTKTPFLSIDLANEELQRSLRMALKGGWENPLVLMKKDGTLVEVEGGPQSAIEESGYFGFPWDQESITKGKEKMSEMFKERDAKYEQQQKDMGLPVIRRLLGSPRGVEQKPEERTIKIPGWMTFGMPNVLISSDTPSNYPGCVDAGVYYYELEVLELGDYVCSQVGFSAPGGMDAADIKGSDGCGDTKETWGVCPIRQEVWNDGSSKDVDFGPKLKKGDIIGLSVNVGAGKMAVSINGSDAVVVFQDNVITSKGVFPCFSIGESELRVNTSSDKFKHSGPSVDDWLKEVKQPEA